MTLQQEDMLIQLIQDLSQEMMKEDSGFQQKIIEETKQEEEFMQKENKIKETLKGGEEETYQEIDGNQGFLIKTIILSPSQLFIIWNPTFFNRFSSSGLS